MKTGSITVLGQTIMEPEAKGKINNTDPIFINNYWKSVFIECYIQGIMLHA